MSCFRVSIYSFFFFEGKVISYLKHFYFQYSKYFSKLPSFISWMFFVVMPPSHQCCLFLIHSSFNGERYSLAWNLFSSGSCTVWKRLDSFTQSEAKSLVLKNLASQVCVPSASCIDWEGAGAWAVSIGVLCVVSLCWVKPLSMWPSSDPGFLPHPSFTPYPQPCNGDWILLVSEPCDVGRPHSNKTSDMAGSMLSSPIPLPSVSWPALTCSLHFPSLGLLLTNFTSGSFLAMLHHFVKENHEW